MNKYEQIRLFESQINVLESQIRFLKSQISALNAGIKTETPSIKVGDLVIITVDKEWVCSAGTIMQVHSIFDGHILVKSADPKYKDSGIYWICNGEFIKYE